MQTSIENQLGQLFEARYHGAVNIAGIRFQLMYSLLRTFDLYKPGAPASVRLEGIEDIDISQHRHIDLKGITISNQYIQVKTSKQNWDWSKFSSSGILQNFLPTWLADPSATLLVVSNFGYQGNLAELVKFCQGQHNSLSEKLKNNIISLLKREKRTDIKAVELLKRISFLRVSEEELYNQSIAVLVRFFELNTPNPDIYFEVLIARMLDWAQNRHEITRPDLDYVRLHVTEQIEKGPHNLAVQNGWIEKLVFPNEEHPEDFFEGKNARPGHIRAELDVRRPIWEDRIDKALQRSKVCIVRASSGQGKSTLIYRYAFEHYNPETTFIIKQLGHESMVAPVKQAIATYQFLNLPLLVVIDNVGASLRCWSNLVAEFAGQEVRFLVTIREEDWYRYSSNISGFVWEVVKPELSLQEAQNIFANFQRQGRVAQGVSSTIWAFEKVQDRKLLIEFTYLVTHGQMLAERLQNQVLEMQRLGEDKAKIEILRLASTAHAYNVKVKIETIIASVDFAQDPGLTLNALENEYLIYIDGVCEGLHIVRSQHLVSLLHNVTPVTGTMAKLIKILDEDNLEVFTSGVFADPSIEHALLLEAVKKRCQTASLALINRIVGALFTASEFVYYRLHQPLFDKAFDQIGERGIFLLCSTTSPFQVIDPIGKLQEIYPDHPNLKLIADLTGQFTPRQINSRYEYDLLRDVIENLSEECLRADISQIGTLLGWCQFAELDPSRIVHFLIQYDWRAQIYHFDLVSARNVLAALHDYAREAYTSLINSDKSLLTSYYKLLSDTLLFEERNGDVYIEFIVGEAIEYPTRHEKTLERLRSLRDFFPDYEHYCSQGLYASIYGMLPPVDDTKRYIPNEALQLEVHAAQNASYLKTVNLHYACQSMFEWQEQWTTLRDMFLESINKCIKLYETIFHGKQPNKVVRELDSSRQNTLLQALHIRELPSSLTQRFEKEQKTVNEWESNVNNFLRQFGEHDPYDAKQQSSHLMRYNLKEAVKKLPEMHLAFNRIMASASPYFDRSRLDERERDEYFYLAEVLDFWFEHSPSHPIHNLRAAINDYQESQRQRFIDSVHTTLGPLEQQGFRFTYPTKPIFEHPLVELYLGFEVLDFERAVEQAATIIVQLASFPLECHFLNLVPLLNGYRYVPSIWRISFDNIAKIADGTLENSTWALLPIEPPPALAEALPSIKDATLDEIKLQAEFYFIYGTLNTVRNVVYLVNSRLDLSREFETQLAENYHQRVNDDLQLMPANIAALAERMRLVATDNIAAKEWLEYCEVCIHRLQSFSDINSIQLETFQPISIWQDTELQSLFGRYLNSRYLKM